MARQRIVIELNHKGIIELLNSAPIGNECQKAAQRIAEEAGPGFRVSSAWHASMNGGRIAYTASTGTYKSAYLQSRDKLLEKAVEKCRI